MQGISKQSLYYISFKTFIFRLTGGELFDKLCEEDYLTEEQACDYTKQVVQGMAYLHSKNIMHLDIKVKRLL